MIYKKTLFLFPFLLLGFFAWVGFIQTATAQNNMVDYLKNARVLPQKLNEQHFLLSGVDIEFEKKHFSFDKNTEDLSITEQFYKVLDNPIFLPEIKSYKEFDTQYTVFAMGKWETKSHYLVMYGSYTPVVHGLASYHLASFDKLGKFINQVDLFAYSLVDGKVRVEFDGKNKVLVKVIVDKSPNEPPIKEDTDFKITLNKQGKLEGKNKIDNKK